MCDNEWWGLNLNPEWQTEGHSASWPPGPLFPETSKYWEEGGKYVICPGLKAPRWTVRSLLCHKSSGGRSCLLLNWKGSSRRLQWKSRWNQSFSSNVKAVKKRRFVYLFVWGRISLGISELLGTCYVDQVVLNSQRFLSPLFSHFKNQFLLRLNRK